MVEINPNSLLIQVFPAGHNWPASLPTLQWRGLNIAGRPDGETLDRSNFEFSDVFKDAHPKLGLGTLARLCKWWQSEDWTKIQELQFLPLFQRYYPRATYANVQTLRALMTTSKEFITWVDEKDLGLRELTFFNWSEFSRNQPESFWKHFCDLQPSRSVGWQLLELYFELAEFGLTPQTLAPDESRAETWLSRLQTQRYPNSRVQDEQRTQWLKSLPWPKSVNAEWVRSGDQTFAEIQMRVTNKGDFSLKLKALERILGEFEEFQT